MLTFKDFAVDQVYRAGPYVVAPSDVQDFPQILGAEGPLETYSAVEQTMFNQWAGSALSMKLIATGELQVEGGTMGLGVDELEWGAPAKVNVVLTLESRVISVRESRSNPDFGIVTIKTTTKNQDGDVIQTFTHALRVAK